MSELKNSLFIGLLTSGVVFFMLPANIAIGGTPGMAMILHYFSGISTGQAMLIVI